MKKSTILQIAEKIRGSNKIVILSHYNPDPDAFGSSLGLTLALRDMGKDVVCVNESQVAVRYKFIPGIETLVSDLPDAISHGANPLIIACDCGDIKRIGDRIKAQIESYPKLLSNFINIDHHISNTYFGSDNYVDASASSTCEIIADLLKQLGYELEQQPSGQKVAQCLLAGLMSDTGCFRYSSVTAETLEAGASLVRAGAKPSEIGVELYENQALAAVRLKAHVLNNIQLFESNRIVIGSASKELKERFLVSSDDTEGLVEELRAIQGVVVAAFIHQDQDVWRVSLRSKSEKVDVAKVAAHFGGGGHRAAAGFRYKNSFNDLTDNLVVLLKQVL